MVEMKPTNNKLRERAELIVAELAGCDVERAWQEFDSGAALEAAGDLVHTGPTGTNVGDLLIGIRRSANSLRGRDVPLVL